MPEFLTERQKAILDFIIEYSDTRGVCPTHREICERFGYSSYGTVHKHLKQLERKGYLRRHWNQKRGLELIAPRHVPAGALVRLPFFGRIAAGRPLEALPGADRMVVPGHLLGAGSEAHYVLQVSGDSMIDEGIRDGDHLVVRRREEARPGELVVALVGEEATVKRYYPEGATVRLQPAHPEMAPLRIPASDVRVQGVVVALMRRL